MAAVFCGERQEQWKFLMEIHQILLKKILKKNICLSTRKEKTSVFLSFLEKNSTIMIHFCHSSTTVNYSKVLYSFKYSHQVLKYSSYYLLPCKSCVTVRKAVYVAELCKAAISLK